MQEYPGQSRVGVFAPDGKSLAFFLTAYQIPAKEAIPAVDQGNKKTKALFADSATRLWPSSSRTRPASPSPSRPTASPIPTTTAVGRLQGPGTKGDGEKAEARARFIVNEGKVDAMVGFAADASSLEADERDRRDLRLRSEIRAMRASRGSRCLSIAQDSSRV